jgi:hypothetical protein
MGAYNYADRQIEHNLKDRLPPGGLPPTTILDSSIGIISYVTLIFSSYAI